MRFDSRLGTSTTSRIIDGESGLQWFAHGEFHRDGDKPARISTNMCGTNAAAICRPLCPNTAEYGTILAGGCVLAVGRKRWLVTRRCSGVPHRPNLLQERLDWTCTEIVWCDSEGRTHRRTSFDNIRQFILRMVLVRQTTLACIVAVTDITTSSFVHKKIATSIDFRTFTGWCVCCLAFRRAIIIQIDSFGRLAF